MTHRYNLSIHKEKTDSFIQKYEKMKALLTACQSKQSLYQCIIDLGKKQSILCADDRIDSRLVPGCQSRMYLKADLQNGLCILQTEADALISAGLAQILVDIYTNEPPHIILYYPPNFIEELGILAHLTPGRANGIASLYHVMKQYAMRWILHSEVAPDTV